MRFIDLFAGLGGFHQALERLGHECVFASELDANLAALYEKNFGIKPHGDIRLNWESVPTHDILCAGFPCQPFSKAGDQLGFECPQWGDLFDYVIRILEAHKPRYLMIENVPNLMKHAGGETWKAVCKRLESSGYAISSSKLSPHMFGVPQSRERAIIVGDREGLSDFHWPLPTHSGDELSITDILDSSPADARPLSNNGVRYLETWQDLLDNLPLSTTLPSFPIWAMEFGATYPFEGNAPSTFPVEELRQYRGILGRSLSAASEADIEGMLPSYARGHDEFPDWKKAFIRSNRNFYEENKAVIDRWLPKIESFAPSFQKLEWNWKGGPRDLWKAIIQFRASGIRAKRPNFSPSLVALTTSQVPVIPWERRYMTMRECARLQSMGDLPHLPGVHGATFKALGNAVNVEVMAAVGRALLGRTTSYPLEKDSAGDGDFKESRAA